MNEVNFKLRSVDKIPKRVDRLDKELQGVITNKIPSIIVDSREASGAKGKKGGQKIYENLLRMEKKDIIKVTVQMLGDAIDYAIPTLGKGDVDWHLIQRKTATEMMNPKKVYEDIIEMKAVERAETYVLLENSLGVIQRFSKMRPVSIIGGVDTILLPQEYGGFNCKIIPSPNQYYTSLWLLRRAIRVGTERKRDIHRIVRESVSKNMEPQEQGLWLLTGLVGVSKTIGVRIMRKYGSAWNAVFSLNDWVRDIKGFGKGKYDNVVKQLTAEWKEKNE